MGKIVAEIVEDKLVVTRYESDGSIIPDKITQDSKVIEIISSNLDTDYEDVQEQEVGKERLAVTREEFIVELLSLNEQCVERYSKYGKGLYSGKDMRKGITWAEAAYLVHYVGGVPNSLDWNTIRPRSIDRVCVLHELLSEGNELSSGNRKVLDEKLASYKNRLDMESYINSIIAGKRYIPLPMYCSFVDLLHNDSIVLDLELDMMFKKVSRVEFEAFFK